MPRPRIIDGSVAWELVHGYTGEVLAVADQPAGSEERGNRPMRPLGSTAAWSGGQVTARAQAVLAPNPGWMTLDGTNSWLLQEPGSDRRSWSTPGPTTRATSTASSPPPTRPGAADRR